MKGSRYSCRIALAALLTAVVCGCAHKLAPRPGSAPLGAVTESAETTFAAPAAQKFLPAAGNPAVPAPGLVVHIDPLTGQILPKPPVPSAGQILDPQQFQSGPVAAPQAVEEANPAPGGGVKVKLNRQFHHPLFATIDGDGKIKFEHRPAHSDLEVK